MTKGKSRILVLEDDLETKKFLKMYLRRFYEADICSSSDSFKKYLASNSYVCIIIDIAISEEITGLDLVRELRNDNRYSEIPIMCVSAHVKERDKKNAYEAGVDLFVGKPFPPNELVNSIDSLIKEKLNSAILKER